ncbi:MAG: toll/interleukin-1 receptor domain-containing protein [Pseudomonadota bacterium]
MGLKDGSTAKYSDLRRSLYLQQHQINVAVGDTGVLLPKGIAHPPHWPDPAPPEQEDAKPKPPTEPAPAPDPFIFLSYASEDRDAAEALLTLLKDQGLPFWWDQYILGDGWRDQIAERLNAAKAVLAVWTEASVASDGVREEAAIAQKAGKLVHARLNDAALPYGFGETQWIDLRRWDGETSHPDFQKLLLSLRTKLDPPSTAEKRARRRAGSAVEAVRDGARITLKNTPVNVAPPRDEPVLKAQRLQALWVNGQGMRDLAEEDGQCPLRIKQVLDHFLATPARDDPDWFVLSFRNDRLRDGLAECPDLDKSNGTLRTGILGLIQQVGELEPFLNPEQPEPDAPQAKPVQLDPELPGDRLEEVAARLSELSDALRTQDANDGLNDGTRAHLSDLADDGANAAADKNHDPAAEDRNVSRARRSLQKLTYALETIVEKAGEKTMKAFLNEAAKGVAERLKPFAEWLASFF